MISFAKKLSENYALDFSTLHLIREWSDGLALCDLTITFNWFKGDHNPQFVVLLVFMNIALIDLTIYNIHHVEDNEEERCPICNSNLTLIEIVCYNCGHHFNDGENNIKEEFNA